MSTDDAKAPHRFPTVPRLQIGNITLLPAVEHGTPVLGKWIKPGGEIVTTTDLEFIAANRGWNIAITFKEQDK